ncbi:hypothetical protein MVQ26_07125 [Fusobacterium necrophorum]|uniref:hypothetical protein n=1 Tax=Fusobacterium TaxID=848 RepID=UPI0001BC66EE|nr:MULTISPECIES: hypothetical protein [Fusobacterium]AVQ16372.1 hypothetical protein C4N16_01980 [Fusobacterium gonidiaformans ATCC 25563]EFS28947.1 hypothetical protein FGAG_01268 [Fusobacterium gonidiaformans ATCC 25563]MDK4483531.1 hypothetical protein [Fusobacterium necrophorum]MDK4499952.1 hypothetical protein [Fusobacterium necrophorum]MDK4507958.1 hypothetical protein [Fusobacterium necrophorum]
MIIVHFYDSIKNVYSVWANSVSDVIENPQNYYHEYKEGMFITEAKLKHPIIKDRILREMSREECVSEGIEIELEEGEIILDKKLIKIHKPSKYHVWNGKEWRIDLEDIKDKINETWKNERQEKIDADLEYKGSMFQMREYIDVKNFEQRGLQIALGQKKLTDKEEWRLKDNTFKEFNYKELLEIVGLWGDRKTRIWNDLKRMWKELEKAKSVEDIEKITWSEGI